MTWRPNCYSAIDTEIRKTFSASHAEWCYVGRMKFTLFRSPKQLNLFAFTADLSGSNLPDEFGPWQKSGEHSSAQTYAGTNLDWLSSSDPVIKAIERYGFYMARSGLLPPLVSVRELSESLESINTGRLDSLTLL
jgi:hypothetical protein